MRLGPTFDEWVRKKHFDRDEREESVESQKRDRSYGGVSPYEPCTLNKHHDLPCREMNCTNIDFADGCPAAPRLCLARRLTGRLRPPPKPRKDFIPEKWPHGFLGVLLGTAQHTAAPSDGTLCLNQLHLVRFQHILERRHATGFANAASTMD